MNSSFQNILSLISGNICLASGELQICLNSDYKESATLHRVASTQTLPESQLPLICTDHWWDDAQQLSLRCCVTPPLVFWGCMLNILSDVWCWEQWNNIEKIFVAPLVSQFIWRAILIFPCLLGWRGEKESECGGMTMIGLTLVKILSSGQ